MNDTERVAERLGASTVQTYESHAAAVRAGKERLAALAPSKEEQ